MRGHTQSLEGTYLTKWVLVWEYKRLFPWDFLLSVKNEHSFPEIKAVSYSLQE